MMATRDLELLRHLAGLMAACLVLVWVMTRGRSARAGLRHVLAHPGLCVPAAMTTAGLALLAWLRPGAPVIESPFGTPWFGLGYGSGTGVVALALVAAGLAGQIGLLEGLAAGRKPDGATMLAGIRRHFATIAAGKFAIAAAVALLASVFWPSRGSRAAMILFVVPSLFMAPLLGTASLHVGRPLAALRDAAVLARTRLFAVGWPVLAQTLLLVGLVTLARRAGMPPNVAAELLTSSASTLSYNAAPFVTGPLPALFATTLTATSLFASTVFVTAHWLGVRDGYGVTDGQRSAAAERHVA